MAVNDQVARSGPLGRFAVQRGQFAVGPIDREGADRSAFLVLDVDDFRDRTEEPPGRVHGQERDGLTASPASPLEVEVGAPEAWSSPSR